MKKTLSILLAVMMLALCFASVAVSAEDPEIFNIKIFGFNSKITGDDAYLYTSVESWASNNPIWAYSIYLVPVEGADGYYTAVKTVNCTGNDGNNDAAAVLAANYFPAFNAAKGELIMTVHSNGASSANACAWGILDGQIVLLKGVNVAGLTVSNAVLEYYYGMEVPGDDDVTSDDVTSDDVTSDDVTSDEVVYPEWSAFWITHFNDGFVEGAGSVFTAEDTAGGWWIHVAFAPVEGYTNVFEVASISNGLSYGDGAVQAIPEGGFVWAANYGNDYPALGLGEIDYTSAGCNAAIDAAATWTVGQQFVFDGLDLEGLTVPTSTPETVWYDDAYVCTAKIKDFVEGDPDAKLVGAEDDTTDESEKTEDAGDATSMLVFAVIALVAIAGSAVVIKTRK